MLVEIYFVARSGFIIWPKYISAVEKSVDDGTSVSEEIIQSIFGIIVIGGILVSMFSKNYKYEHVRYLLFVQGIQMAMTSLHRYRSDARADDDQVVFENF